MKAVLIMGSTFDEPHAKKITDKLDDYGISWEQHAASAHKQPLKGFRDFKKQRIRERSRVYYYCWKVKRAFRFCCSKFRISNDWMSPFFR